MSNYYITTPIYYVNADPHIGTAYTTVLADTMSRYQSLLGKDTYFLTGTDEHGEKIAQAAEKNGKTPKQFVDEISKRFKELWPKLHIAPDRFIRTTDSDHEIIVRKILQTVYDRGDIYFGEYGGHYCTGCERFLTEKELIEGKCPAHGTVPTYVKEQNYFFRMSKYQDWLIQRIESDPEFIRPERYRNEVLGFLREPLEDLCISRPKTRLTWGIEIPFDDRFVTYVWFDALINYLTGIEYGTTGNWEPRWASVEHVIGKDILKPHGIYWPTMLKAAGIEPFRHLTVHGYWNFRDAKISKSAGKLIAADPLIRAFGADAVRYFLTRDMVVGLDANFSIDSMVSRINSDLANDLGNLLSRVSKLLVDHFDGRTPPQTDSSPLSRQAEELLQRLPEWINQFKLHQLIEETMQFVRSVNRYFDSEAPWSLVKSDKARAGSVLYDCAEALRIAAIILHPVMPERMNTLLGRLGVPVEKFRLSDICWGGLRADAKLSAGEVLFPRIDENKLPELLPELYGPAEEKKPQRVEPPMDNLIDISEFAKVKLETAKITAAEPVPKTQKLLRLEVDLAGRKKQIVAGIAEHYRPEDLIGRLIVVVVNLKPAKLRGLVSEGMLLAAQSDGRMALLTVDKEMPSGASVG